MSYQTWIIFASIFSVLFYPMFSDCDCKCVRLVRPRYVLKALFSSSLKPLFFRMNNLDLSSCSLPFILSILLLNLTVLEFFSSRKCLASFLQVCFSVSFLIILCHVSVFSSSSSWELHYFSCDACITGSRVKCTVCGSS